MDLSSQPWPWWLSGILIGLIVPLMVLLTSKPFGISTSFQQIGAMCWPHSKLAYFRNYDRQAGLWRLVFVLGIAAGGWMGARVLTKEAIEFYPPMFSSLQGTMQLFLGGFLVGFGARYAGGCTSGHAITGISNLNGPSLLATVCFFIGGLAVTWGLGFLIL